MIQIREHSPLGANVLLAPGQLFNTLLQTPSKRSETFEHVSGGEGLEECNRIKAWAALQTKQQEEEGENEIKSRRVAMEVLHQLVFTSRRRVLAFVSFRPTASISCCSCRLLWWWWWWWWWWSVAVVVVVVVVVVGRAVVVVVVVVVVVMVDRCGGGSGGGGGGSGSESLW